MTNFSSNNSEFPLEICNISTKVRDYGLVIWFILGFLLNSFVIMFFCQKSQIQNISISIYIVGMALSNQIILIFELPYQYIFMSSTCAYEICKLDTWVRLTFSEVSSWLLVALSVDRAMIFRINKITEIVTNNNKQCKWRILAVISIYILFMLLNFVFLVPDMFEKSELVYYSKFQSCEDMAYNYRISSSYINYYFLYQLLYSYLPALILIILNSIVIYTLYELMFISMINSSSQRDKKIKQIRQNEAIILLITIVFLLTNLPYEILMSLISYSKLDASYLIASHYLKLFEISAYWLNFFCYFLALKRLKQYVINLINVCFKRKTVEITKEDENLTHFETSN